METQEVCRLCLKKDDLIWVFDKRRNATKNLKEIVYITTGVEIQDEDVISQKICEECCEISITLYQFRQQSLKNNRYLENNSKKKLENKISSKLRLDTQVQKHVEQTVKSIFKIHPSIEKLFKDYPDIKVPSLCLQQHMEPHINLEKAVVEKYFKKKNLNRNKSINEIPTKTPPKILSFGKKCASQQVTFTSTDEKTNKDSFDYNDERGTSSKNSKTCKRKLLDNTLSSEPVTKKPTVIDDDASWQKKIDAIEYYEKSMRRLKEKHLNFQFCKNMDSITKHIESSCRFKDYMNNVPSIPLEKVDEISTIDKVHRSALEKYPQATLKRLAVNVTTFNSTTGESTKNPNMSEARADGAPHIQAEDEIHSNNVFSTSEDPVTVTPALAAPPESEIKKKRVVSSSLVIPDININNCNILKTVNTKNKDSRIVADLLHVKLDKSSQTEPSCPGSINVHQKRRATLKDFKHILKSYNVRIQIQEGPFNVEYSFQEPPRRERKLEMWDDLMVHDVCKAYEKRQAPVALVEGYSTPFPPAIRGKRKSKFPLPEAMKGVQVSSVYGSRFLPNNSVDLSSTSLSSKAVIFSPQIGHSFTDDQKRNNNVGTASIGTSTVTSKPVDFPRPGTIRVRKIWELK